MDVRNLSRRLCLWLSLAGWTVLLFMLLLNCLRRLDTVADTEDFGHFYGAAQAMANGGDIYSSWHGGYIYPPLIAFLYSPLAKLPAASAALILLLFNLALLMLTIVLSMRELSRRFRIDLDPVRASFVALLGTLLIADKIKGELQMWQTNLLVLTMFTAALCLLDRLPLLAGMCLGFAFNIKYMPIVALPYLLLRRRWAAAAAFVVSIVAFALLPATLTGWDVNARNLSVAFGGLLRLTGTASVQSANVPPITASFSLSIVSAVCRLCGGDRLTPLALVLLLSIVLAVLATAWWMYARNGVALLYRPDGARKPDEATDAVVALEWVGLLVGVLAFSPQTNSRHLSILLFATLMSALLLMCPRPGVSRWPLAIGTMVLWLALTMPPASLKLVQISQVWRNVGGPCWCALILFGTLLWVGQRFQPVRDPIGKIG